MQLQGQQAVSAGPNIHLKGQSSGKERLLGSTGQRAKLFGAAVLSCQVFVERSVHATEFPDLEPFDPSVTQVDFAITLGGDGTVL